MTSYEATLDQEKYGRRKILQIAAACLIMALLATGIGVFITWTGSLEEDLILGGAWCYTTEDDTMAYVLRNTKRLETVNANQPLIMYVELEAIGAQEQLYFQGNHQRVRVLLEDRVLAELHLEDEDPGLWDATINLPQTENMATLTLEITSPYQSFSGIPIKLYRGPHEQLRTYLLAQSFQRVLLAGVALFAGLFLIFISMIRRIGRKTDWGSVAFGLFTAMFSIYSVFFREGPDYSIYALFSPQTIAYVSMISFNLIMIPFNVAMIARISKENRRWASLPLLLVGAFFLSTSAMDAYGISSLESTQTLYTYLVIIFSLYGVIVALVDLREGNKRARQAMIFQAAMGLSLWLDASLGKPLVSGMPIISINYITVFLLIALGLLSTTVSYIQDAAKGEAEKRAILLREQLAMESYQNIHYTMDRLRKLRHELRNHAAALDIIMEHGEYDQARDYLHENLLRQTWTSNVVYSENYLVDGIINSRIGRIQEAEIEFHHQLNVPENLPLSDNKFCSLLMNLLDNAIEGCCTLENADERYLYLEMNVKKPYFSIKCVNAKGKKTIRGEHGKYETTKSNRERHGFGIPIMTRIVEENGGIMDIEDEERSFGVSIALLMQEDL